MKLIIDISDNIYDHIKGYCKIFDSEYAYTVNAIANGTPLDSIIADIEAARDKDKLCEYPYNRCINIIKKAVDDES